MKGGFYGLRAKQLSLFLVAVVCTTILIFGWAKAPILSSLVPPQSPVLQLPPDEELKVSEGISGSGSQSESADLEALVHSTDSSSSVSGNDSKSSIPVPGISQETTMKATKDSGVQHVSEEENSSKEQKQVSEGLSGSEDPSEGVDLVALVHSANTSSFASGNETKNSVYVPGISQETTMKATEDSGLEQVSKGENSSKDAVDLVEPVSSTSPNVSLTGTENNNLKTPAEKQACNYAKGKWITDDNRPLYSGFGCKQWLSSMWACRLTQRTDFAYEKLRWQPKNCAMEDFTRSKFLKRMQNKTLAFIGDSLGRQQFQSLMCMVTGGEESPEVLDVGKEYGLIKARGHVRPDGWAYRFPRTNTTILYYWSASLSDLEPLNITNPATEYAMHLDRPPAFLRHFLPKFNVLVLNTGHHWNRGKLRANKWVMHVGGKPNTDRKIANIEGAKNFTIYSIVNWVNSELPKYPDLKAFYRSISPRHFFNGDWNTGGTCDNPSPRLGELEVLQDESFDPVAAGSVKGKRVKLLDITALSQLRDEGHISRYSIKATPGVQDCLHWCLPGVPDTWNELLFAQI